MYSITLFLEPGPMEALMSSEVSLPAFCKYFLNKCNYKPFVAIGFKSNILLEQSALRGVTTVDANTEKSTETNQYEKSHGLSLIPFIYSECPYRRSRVYIALTSSFDALPALEQK